MRSTKPYAERVEKLSLQSVRKHFDAYEDVDWEAPESAIDPADPRWERPGDDPLGATAWYRALPQHTRARLGLHLVVAQLQVGLEFERVLKRGLLELAGTLPHHGPELRYVYHEVIEEAQHSLMFHELIKRSGLEAPGMFGIVRWGSERTPALGRRFPERFFIHVLAGETPIDHVQRKALARGDALHPLLRRVMQIHVTEEARHVCFAREYLRKHVPLLSRVKRVHLQIAAPLVLAGTSSAMLDVPPRIVELYRMPESVVDEAFRHNLAHRAEMHQGLAPVRDLCGELGLITRWSRPLWRALGLETGAF